MDLMRADNPLVNRFVLGVDIENYSGRNARQQAILQERLKSILEDTANDVGLDRARWRIEPQGDGENSELPPDVDLSKVAGTFVRALQESLRRHNEDYSADLALRVRLAMHIDVLKQAPYGATGQAFVELARLLNADLLREALKQSDRAYLALLVSVPVFDKVILSGFSELRAEDFARVRVVHQNKGYQKFAYLHVPGRDMATYGPRGDHARPAGESAAEPVAKPAGGPADKPAEFPAESPSGQVAESAWHFDDVSGNVFAGNSFSGNTTITVNQQSPRDDPLPAGLTALRGRQYSAAISHLEKAVLGSEKTADAYFYLALALLRGVRPRKHERQDIRRVEHVLRQALEVAQQHPGARLLWAIVKQDHYLSNDCGADSPSVDELFRSSADAIFASRDHAIEILRHTTVRQSPVWRFLEENFGAEGAGNVEC